MTSSWGDLFFDHHGRVVDKWEHYLDVYDRVVGARAAREEPLVFLEIGVQNGGSLEIWQKYLPAGSQIFGMDINPDVAELKFTSNTIKVGIGDASNASDIVRLFGNMVFDIIVDDGSHVNSDIIATLTALLPQVRPGGVYIIEDLHASYLPQFGGGYGSGTSAIAHLKNVIDGLHYEYLDPGMFSEPDRAMLAGFHRQIASISFYDSVAVIETHAVPRDAPYLRLISGVTADVVPLSRLSTTSVTSPSAIRVTGRPPSDHWWQTDLQRQISDCQIEIVKLQQQLKRASVHRPFDQAIAAPLPPLGNLDDQ